jgi:hypothetical protein
MLPDYPSIKKDITARLEARTKAGVQAEPLQALLPAFLIHEGNRSLLIREDRSNHEYRFDNPVTARATIQISDIASEGPAATLKAVDEITAALQADLARRTLKAMEDAAESVGHVIRTRGEAITADTYLQLLDTVELSFSDSGAWHQPTVLAAPETSVVLEAIKAQVEADVELRARRDAIVERQRREWHVREASRRLAD